MELYHLQTTTGDRWAVGNRLLREDFTLSKLLELPGQAHADFVRQMATEEEASGSPLAPIDPHQEVWASGVTFLRSREAREAESATGDIYQRVYVAERPELFFKAPGWRVVAPGGTIRVRPDSSWNVPEPELTLVINRFGEICGFCAGNDVSSRSIEGENPLYLPQAKVYNGSCALGPFIRLSDDSESMQHLPIKLEIFREGQPVFSGSTGTDQMKRRLAELVKYLFAELDFPTGAFLMTGTGIVPAEPYTLTPGDEVHVTVGELTLKNATA